MCVCVLIIFSRSSLSTIRDSKVSQQCPVFRAFGLTLDGLRHGEMFFEQRYLNYSDVSCSKLFICCLYIHLFVFVFVCVCVCVSYQANLTRQ